VFRIMAEMDSIIVLVGWHSGQRQSQRDPLAELDLGGRVKGHLLDPFVTTS